MDRGAWRATVYGVAESRTGLKRRTTLSTLELLIYTLCVKKTETKTWVNVLHCLTHFPSKSANLPAFQNECLSPFLTLSSEPEIQHHLFTHPFPQGKTNKQKALLTKSAPVVPRFSLSPVTHLLMALDREAVLFNWVISRGF